MSEATRVLIAEDSDRDAELVVHELQRSGLKFESRRVQTEADFRRALDEFRPQIILSDFAMPGFGGVAALSICRETGIEIPFIFISGTIGEDVAVEAMKAGADDYVMKTNLIRLGPTVQRALREAGVRRDYKAAEEALRRFKLALDNSADMILISDVATMRHVDVNQTACELLGYTREELLRMGPQDILPVTREALARAYAGLIANPAQASGMTSYYLCKDGSHLPFESTRRVLLSENRWIMAAVSRDIRERLAAEQELQRFRLAMDATVDSIYLTDPAAMRFVYLNNTACERLGYTREQLLQLGPQDVLPMNREDISREYDEVVAAGDRGLRQERPFVRSDGSEGWTELHRRAVRTEGGVLIVTIGRDISERKAADERIRRLNRIYAVLSGINALIVRVNNRDELFEVACQVAVEEGHFKMAWIGVVDQSAMKIDPVASAGAELEFLTLIKDRWSLREEAATGNTRTARAVREKKAIVANNIGGAGDTSIFFEKERIERGIRSMAILPLLVAGEAVGVLALYAGETGFFDDEEIKLLTELSGDIAFAVDHLDKAERLQIEAAVRARAEAKVTRLNRVYAVLSGINSAIVRIRERDELFRETSRIAVSEGGFILARVLELDSEGRARIAATSESDSRFYQQVIDEYNRNPEQSQSLLAIALRSGQPQISNDVAGDPRIPDRVAATKAGNYALALLPIVVEKRVAGAITLRAREAGMFDEAELHLLLELIANLSFALEHIEKEAKVRRLTRVYAVLSGINSAIARIRDREELLKEACRIAVSEGGFLLARVIGLDKNGKAHMVATTERDSASFLAVLNEFNRDPDNSRSLLAQALRTGKITVSNAIAGDSSVYNRAELNRSGTYGLALFPLTAGERVIGVYLLRAGSVDIFNGDELKLLNELARNLSFALESFEKTAHLKIETAERALAEVKVMRLNRVYAVLSGINALIVRVHERDELFQGACRIAVEAGGLPVAWIGEVDRDAMQVRPVAGVGTDDAFLSQIRMTIKEDAPEGLGLVGQAINARAAFVSNDIANDPRITAKRTVENDTRSVAVLPLVVGDEALGVLVLHAEATGFFDEEEMKLLTELAGDISFALDHIEKANRLDYLAYYDQLTGLANRALFQERLTQHIHTAGNSDHKVAVVVADIERFRMINDSLGRQAGDALLKQVAERLARVVDQTEIARVGADYFAIVLPEMRGRSEIGRTIEGIWRDCLDEPFRLNDTDIRIAMRGGIALFPSDGASADTLFSNAEAAWKNAKKKSERYVFHSQEMTARITESLALENKLRQALQKEEFVLYYQPKVDLETRRIVAVEALIRWQSPELGLVPPLKFIPLMEETGMILEAGAWALKRAAADHRGWVEQQLRAPRVAVNVSAIQLRQKDFVSTVEQAIIEGVAPTGIDLEITESLVMEDVEGNIRKLKEVRALGIEIAIDDFGTGYSSLAYLAKLPVNTLKIDRAFIVTMLKDADTMTLVSTMISLAHSLRLAVVAEGVETEEQAKMLRLLRCDQMQGYLFSRPVPLDEITAMLKKPAQG